MSSDSLDGETSLAMRAKRNKDQMVVLRVSELDNLDLLKRIAQENRYSPLAARLAASAVWAVMASRTSALMPKIYPKTLRETRNIVLNFFSVPCKILKNIDECSGSRSHLVSFFEEVRKWVKRRS